MYSNKGIISQLILNQQEQAYSDFRKNTSLYVFPVSIKVPVFIIISYYYPAISSTTTRIAEIVTNNFRCNIFRIIYTV